VTEPVGPDFFTVVRQQRACRAFSDAPVPDALLARVLEAATFAPSAENRQPWELVVVRAEAARLAIGDLMRRAWDSYGREHSRDRLAPTVFADVDRGATGGVAAAPVLVVVGGDRRRGLPAAMASSLFPAIQNLLLAAQALGLGAALTTIATAYADELRAAVGFPPEIDPVAVIPLGYPAHPLGPPRRDPFREHAHRERYGQAWAPPAPS
jgi:nitroreductase